MKERQGSSRMSMNFMIINQAQIFQWWDSSPKTISQIKPHYILVKTLLKYKFKEVTSGRMTKPIWIKIILKVNAIKAWDLGVYLNWSLAKAKHLNSSGTLIGKSIPKIQNRCWKVLSVISVIINWVIGL